MLGGGIGFSLIHKINQHLLHFLVRVVTFITPGPNYEDFKEVSSLGSRYNHCDEIFDLSKNN